MGVISLHTDKYLQAHLFSMMRETQSDESNTWEMTVMAIVKTYQTPKNTQLSYLVKKMSMSCGANLFHVINGTCVSNASLLSKEVMNSTR